MSRAFDRALFHGTLAHIDKIDVTQGKPRKDFGRGFYLALSAEQAIGMMHKKLREATRRSRNKSSEGLVERLYKVQLKPKAKQTLLEVLEPENLGVQCCLCTPKAVELAVMSMSIVDWRMFA